MRSGSRPGSKPRLLFCSDHSYWDSSSGAAQGTRDLLEILAGRGWHCEALCGTRLGFEEPTSLEQLLRSHRVAFQCRQAEVGPSTLSLLSFTQGGVSVTACEPPSAPPSESCGSADEKFLPALLDRALDGASPDLVLTNAGDRWAQAIVTRARERAVPVVCTLDRVDPSAVPAGRSADAVMVPSRFAEEACRRHFGLESVVLPGPWNWARVRCPDTHDKYVTFVNPHPEKGLFPFARLVMELGRRRPDIPLLVVEARAKASRLNRSGLDLRGLTNLFVMANTPEPQDFYKVSRLVLVPSLRGDSHSRVAAEALINGIPVLATRRGGLPEILEHAGFLVDLPARYTPESQLPPTAEEMRPWLDLIIRLWDDAAFYDAERQRCWVAAEAWRPFRLGDRFEALFGEVRRRQARRPTVPTTSSEAPSLVGPEDHPAASASPPQLAAVPLGATPARVSLCMIVKDEERNLPDCLRPVADLVSEIVVVDTGSTDRTREVAAGFGARVFDVPWKDSFAAARNESLRLATRDWVFWLDADDRLDPQNRQRLQVLFAGLRDENVAYLMKCVLPEGLKAGVGKEVDHLRLFHRHPEAHWEYRVHEQILPALRRLGRKVQRADVVIRHVGNPSEGSRRQKVAAYHRLLELENAERPNDPYMLFKLGESALSMQGPAAALPLLRRSLARGRPNSPITPKLYGLIAHCHRSIGQPAEALAACQEGRRRFPADAALLFREAQIRREQGDLGGAEERLLGLLGAGARPGLHLGEPTGLNDYKARNELALVYRHQGRMREAEAQWLAVVAEHPEFAWAWYGLAGMYLQWGEWSAVERIGRGLEDPAATDPPGRVLAVALRARLHMARREPTAARTVLEAAVSELPEEALLWVLLSHALLQEDKDLGAAERALRRVLELSPGSTEARHNLRILNARLGKPTGD